MSTAQVIIRDALKIVGLVQTNEVLKPGQAEDHLRTLNRMLASWDTERLLVYTVDVDAYTLVPMTQSYTLGPGGSMASVRPNRIEQAYIRVLSGTQPYDRPLKIVYDEGWASIGVKTTQSPIPTILYNQGDYPQTTLYLWPVPTVANQLVLYTWNQLSQIANINSNVDFPPGYEDAVIYNLAARLAPEYGFSLDSYSMSIATLSKDKLRALNTSPVYQACDKAILGRRKLGFNYLTGEFGRS